MSKKTIEETYKKLEIREHVLHRPGMYIGSVDPHTEEMWIFENGKMIKKMITYTPGFLKIFDEILTNATDHATRDNTLNSIKVNIDVKTGEINVWNNGEGIPVEIHKEHNMYVPELIFGNMLSGSNFNDADDRTGAGTNGLGSTVVAIYSQTFTVETVDSKNGLKFIQTFSNNLLEKSKPKVTKNNGKSYTKITFLPDYNRFKMKSLDQDTFGLLSRRVYDCIACTDKHVSIYLNNEKLKGKGLQDYTRYYFDEKVQIFYDTNSHDKYLWEWVVIPNEHFEQVSFVNGNNTYNGGKHIDHLVTYQIVSKLKTMIESKRKIKDLKPSYIKDKLFVFLRATIKNPSFSSQTKEQLTTQVKDFGVKIDVSEQFLNKLYKSTIIDEIVELCKFKEQKELNKATDGAKKSKVIIPKLEDAIWAGTSKSDQCTLILTEGDSAKTFAMWGRSVINLGIEKYALYPLRGKFLNVRDATVSQLLNNEEINNLKQIVGLKNGKVYKNTSELRYGKIMILTDADHDGSHIKSLLVNLFHYWWPSLLELDFLQTLRTPIVVAIKGRSKKEFFTEGDYNEWYHTNTTNGWTIKYFKGLGTSTKEDAKDIFSRMDTLKINYYYKNKECDTAIELAFEKDKNIKGEDIKLTDKRKLWLEKYNKNSYLDSKINKVSYQDLINKELIHFSIYDNMRSIPNMIDGLKPSQRKILYYMLKKCNTKDEIKVAQLSGYVSAETNYHHGEASLQQAIINMAQDYVGTNNLNLLYPSGNYGSRYIPSSSASPRYIFTKLMEYSPIIFDKRDNELLKYINDDGDSVEPEFFVPIIPMVLVNGISGIGTGYSTYIPPYNPIEIISNIHRILDGLEPFNMKPYYRNFNGLIQIDPDNKKYYTKGIYERLGDTLIRIKELPIGSYVTSYKEFLENQLDNKDVKKYKLPIKNVINKTKDEANICFDIEFKSKDDLDLLINNNTIEKDLKLEKSYNLTNMYLFDKNSVPVKYTNVNHILKEFVNIRLEYYTERKIHLLNKLDHELTLENAKLKFLMDYMNDVIQLNKKNTSDIIHQMETLKYYKLLNSYDYLLNIPLKSLTKDKIQELKNKIKLLTDEYNKLNVKSEKHLWIDDLEFLKSKISS